jgi:uncharacterized UBP type Zn finger protein
MPQAPCPHLQNFEPKPSGKHVCEECAKTGSRWVHLRTCQTCGATLCCDSSPNTHMTKHFYATGHPLMFSAEPGEYWAFCYEHDSFIQY